jgi:DNA (cytosine-5)-methyltransferase 1
MDTTQAVTHISLCAGYGGIDLGLRGAIPNLRTVAFSEIEAFATANLVAKMEAGHLDAAPIWTDLKTFPWGAFRDRVDILSGGYPCQPFSAAGKRLGTDDPRHLWPFIADGIRILRPKLCFFENVEGHISLGLREVISELESMGYAVSWGIFSAREVGAPHQRKRVFIMAHRKCEGLERWRSAMQSEADRCWTSNNTRKSRDLLADSDNSRSRENIKSTELRPGGIEQSSSDPRRDESREAEKGSTQSGEAMANPNSFGSTRSRDELGVPSETRQGRQDIATNRLASAIWPTRPGQPQHGWEPPRVVGNTSNSRRDNRDKSEQSIQVTCRGYGENNATDSRKTEPSLGRDADGSPSGLGYAELCVTCDNRTDELRLLGNGVVPATATLAFQTLLAELLTL